ncbi:hypothetical protein HUW51_19470 [Adhaeribacter swui]|uniref:Uncharacterized protein n=1 Tax=Adhaeribacter swui TaxID=2086471 RepID=A0A7G7GCB6_9BACT|nr:hypothetical protein [Adhaeribacter swui]QNF34800.1 hypothetical protein HUW51_19470 [Adhaeribacter swui]
MVKVSLKCGPVRATLMFLIGVALTTADLLAQKTRNIDSLAIWRRETQEKFKINPEQPLQERVKPASAETLKMFRDAGMAPTEHTLTTAERQQLQEVFAALPPLHQQVLQNRLRSISFLDNMPNTALTATVNPDAKFPVFDLTVRAAIFKQTASEWMTEKERTCFKSTGSSLAITCDIGSLSAMLYVILHEATHMVDVSLQIGQSAGFSKNIWKDRTHLTATYSHSLLDSTRYRGGKPIPISKAKAVYQALSHTPLVSLYSTNSWNEDLAEYLSIYHFTQKLNQPFKITLRNKGKEVWVFEPLKSKLARQRFGEMKRFYQTPPTTAG